MANLTRPADYSVEAVAVRPLSDSAFELELTRPPEFTFTPGQRIRIFHQGVERDYSLISSPAAPALKLCFKLIPDGKMTPILAKAAAGQRFDIHGPMGYFTFNTAAGRKAVFIASGTGVAPFVSMVRDGASGFILLHGVRDESELYYRSELEKAADLYVPCLTAAQAAPDGAYIGRVTDYIREKLPQTGYDFYLCGRSEMTRDATFLVDDIFPESRVFTEIFF